MALVVEENVFKVSFIWILNPEPDVANICTRLS